MSNNPSAKPRLVLFWEGPKPARIRLCEETVKLHCKANFDLLLLNYSNVFDYIDPSDKVARKIIESEKIHVAHKADFIRTVVLYETGGFWIDSDYIVLRDFSHFTKFVKKRDFAGTTSFFCCANRSRTVKFWRKAIEKKLLGSNPPGFDDSRYLEPSEAVYKYKHWKYFAGITREMIRPISFRPYGIKKLYSKDVAMRDIITKKTCAVTIWNSLVPEWFKKLNRKEILEGDWLISKLYRKGLKG